MLSIICVIGYFVLGSIARYLIYSGQYMLSYTLNLCQMAVSIPLMYTFFKKKVKNKKVLWCAIILFNIFWNIMMLYILHRDYI